MSFKQIFFGSYALFGRWTMSEFVHLEKNLAIVLMCDTIVPEIRKETIPFSRQ